MVITDSHIDALKELMNIGVGRGAAILNTMLSCHIKLHVPDIRIIGSDEFYSDYKPVEVGEGERLSVVNLSFKGKFRGDVNLIFTTASAIKLVTALTGEEPDPGELDTIQAGTLTEVGNIVLNSVMGTMGNLLKIELHYSVPAFGEGDLETLFSIRWVNEKPFIQLAKVRFNIEELDIKGDIILMFEIGSFDFLLEKLDIYIK